MESDFLCAVYGLSGVNSGLTQVINLHCKYSILPTNQNCSPVIIVLSIRYSACCDVLLLLLFFLLLLIVS